MLWQHEQSTIFVVVLQVVVPDLFSNRIRFYWMCDQIFRSFKHFRYKYTLSKHTHTHTSNLIRWTKANTNFEWCCKCLFRGMRTTLAKSDSKEIQYVRTKAKWSVAPNIFWPRTSAQVEIHGKDVVSPQPHCFQRSTAKWNGQSERSDARAWEWQQNLMQILVFTLKRERSAHSILHETMHENLVHLINAQLMSVQRSYSFKHQIISKMNHLPHSLKPVVGSKEVCHISNQIWPNFPAKQFANASKSVDIWYFEKLMVSTFENPHLIFRVFRERERERMRPIIKAN